jgi:hypothetical protein
MAWYEAQASNNGGIDEVRRAGLCSASLISAAAAPGNADQSSARAPVTKGVATLVPPSVRGPPPEARPTTSSAGALLHDQGHGGDVRDVVDDSRQHS